MCLQEPAPTACILVLNSRAAAWPPSSSIRTTVADFVSPGTSIDFDRSSSSRATQGNRFDPYIRGEQRRSSDSPRYGQGYPSPTVLPERTCH